MPRIDRSEFVREFNHAKKSLGLTDWETKIDHLLSN